jgi:hypothetical protein
MLKGTEGPGADSVKRQRNADRTDESKWQASLGGPPELFAIGGDAIPPRALRLRRWVRSLFSSQVLIRQCPSTHGILKAAR